MLHPVQLGKRTRMSYSRIDEVLEMPNLIEVQKNSYKWFLEKGLQEVFDDVSPITDYTENLVLEFVDYYFDENPKYSVEECKDRDVTYSKPLKVRVRLINRETGEVKEQEVFMGDFPIMTDQGTFVINGAERVIVSQLVRSPGVYYAETIDKTGKPLYSATLIPNRGAWLEYETDSNDIMYVRVDRTRKINVTVLLRALGYGTDIQLKELLGEDERLLATIDSDNANSVEEGLLEIYKRLRPGEPPTVESANQLLRSLLFDSKRYDLARVGRYKFNKKLALSARISGRVAAATVVDPNSGEILAEAGERISREKADEIQNAGINEFLVQLDNDRVAKVVGNYFVDAGKYLSFDPYEVGINEKVHYPTLKVFLDQGLEEDALKATLKESLDELIPKHVLIDDIIASVISFRCSSISTCFKYVL
jgi:DNA-directed RNA polymerase subunit beta